MDGEEPPDREALGDLLLWVDEGLTDEEVAAIATRSPWDVPDLDEDWQDLGWLEWGGSCASLIGVDPEEV